MRQELREYYGVIASKNQNNPQWNTLLHRTAPEGFSYDPFAMSSENQQLHIDHIYRCLSHIKLLGVYRLFLTEKSTQSYAVGIFQKPNGELSHTYLRNLYKNQDCGVKKFTNLFYLDVLEVGERLEEVYLNPLKWGNVGNLSWVGNFKDIRWLNNDELMVPIKNKPYFVKTRIVDLTDNRKWNSDPLQSYSELPKNTNILKGFEFKDSLKVFTKTSDNVTLYHTKTTKLKIYDATVDKSHTISLHKYNTNGHYHPTSTGGFSIYENLFYQALEKLEVNFIKEWGVTDGNKKYRFDFYLPEQNLIFELDGLQHFTINSLISYRVQQEIDKTKALLVGDIEMMRVCIPHLKDLLKYSGGLREDMIEVFCQYIIEKPSMNLNDYAVGKLSPYFLSLADWFKKKNISHPLY